MITGNLKYIIAFLPARALFYAGDVISWQRFNNDIDPIEDIRWAFYQWAMKWSLRFDDWGDTKLWKTDQWTTNSIT